MNLFTPTGFLSAGFYGPRGGDSTFYNFSIATTSPPAPGQVRLNDPTPASASLIYIHETNRDNVNVAIFLDQIIPGSQIILIDDANRSNYATFTVTLVVDNGTDRTIFVTYQGSGTFNDNAKLWFSILTTAAPPVLPTNAATVDDIRGLLAGFVKKVMDPGDTLTFTSSDNLVRRIMGVENANPTGAPQIKRIDDEELN